MVLGSGKNLFRIPDPGVKKHPIPDPGSGSAKLVPSVPVLSLGGGGEAASCPSGCMVGGALESRRGHN
jgi:hypothetical protein